jgi:8-oxo-dGTP pyrophosphatase MutT (NUDIX family)
MTPEDPAPPRLVVAAALVWLGAPLRREGPSGGGEASDQLLVQRRPASARHGAGALELPGGKLERGEGPREALARELREEWGPCADELTIGSVAEVLHHVYPAPGPEVILIVLNVDARVWADGRWQERIAAPPGVEVLAFSSGELPVEEFLAADRPFISAIRSRSGTPPG